MFLLLYLCLLFLTMSSMKCDTRDNKIEQCDLPVKIKEEIASYQPIADRIINYTLHGDFKGKTYDDLAFFVDKFGSRLTGTDNLENAIDFMLSSLSQAKLDNVHGENVTVPVWVRGDESATLVSPRPQKFNILGLGNTVGTPKEGITAEVLVVTSFDELAENSSKAKNKIVVFVPEYVSYGETVIYRSRSAINASSYGAVAALVRSITPFSINSPHTGMMSYDNKYPKIPVACITVEDAHMLKRMQDRGEKIVISLKMGAKTYPDSVSRNTVAEIKGKVKPEQVVIVSGHLDSWDVGQGAMDDGGGAFISWEALALLRKLGLRPKRTLRAILWTGEEFGYVGAVQYAKQHESEIENVLFALESDIGTFNPLGIEHKAGELGGCIIDEIVKLLAPINATQSVRSKYNVGSDIEVFQALGVPGGSLFNENEKYFWYHHSSGDMMDVENPDELDRSTALWAVVSYVLADLSIDFPRN